MKPFTREVKEKGIPNHLEFGRMNAGYLLQNFSITAGNLQKVQHNPAEGLETKAVVLRAACVF